jgi:hypothetical protein
MYQVWRVVPAGTVGLLRRRAGGPTAIPTHSLQRFTKKMAGRFTESGAAIGMLSGWRAWTSIGITATLRAFDVFRAAGGHMNRRHLLHICALLVVGLAVEALTFSASAAVAAPPTPSQGVHVDPNSPVAKEYSIPLSNARGAAAGTADPGPLFGSGITKRGPGSSGGASAGSAAVVSISQSPSNTKVGQARGGSAKRHASNKGSPAAAGAATPVSAVSADAAPPPAVKVLRSGSGSAVAWMVGLAVVVLALGGLGGYLVTRRGHQMHPS